MLYYNGLVVARIYTKGWFISDKDNVKKRNIEYLVKDTFSSLQIVAIDLLIPFLASRLPCWIWSSIRKK